MIGYFLAIVAIVFVLTFLLKRERRIREYQLPTDAPELLESNVAFYRALDAEGRAEFEERVRDFLAHVTITGVEVVVEDLDRLLVASGAIIPIYAFHDWKYINISEVLLYEGAFNEEYQTRGKGRHLVGMVGTGAMHRVMILSKPALRESFAHPERGQNVAIHEFVHLIDKSDGATDGIPEVLLARPYVLPWMEIMHKTIKEMCESDASDINPYGATNDSEFFAVAAEYFFEKPGALQANHPELYAMLKRMFTPVEKA